MWSYVLKRLLFLVPTLLIILSLNFFLIHAIPGDPLQLLSGDLAPTPALIAYANRVWGLNKPLIDQYFLYMQNVLSGNLGKSLYFNVPVLSIVLPRAVNTIILVALAVILSSLIGVALALASATRKGTKLDTGIVTLSLLGYSLPLFWLGQLLVMAFAVYLPIFPTSGMTTPGSQASGLDYAFDVIRHLVLPVTTLGLVQLAVVARVGRAKLIDILDENYIVAARAKGVDSRTILMKHALKNALVVIVTLVGMRMAYIISASAVVETIFGWPGLGSLLIFAILRRDYMLVLGAFFIFAVIVAFATLFTEIIYTRIDKRIVLR